MMRLNYADVRYIGVFYHKPLAHERIESFVYCSFSLISYVTHMANGLNKNIFIFGTFFIYSVLCQCS